MSAGMGALRDEILRELAAGSRLKIDGWWGLCRPRQHRRYRAADGRAVAAIQRAGLIVQRGDCWYLARRAAKAAGEVE